MKKLVLLVVGVLFFVATVNAATVTIVRDGSYMTAFVTVNAMDSVNKYSGIFLNGLSMEGGEVDLHNTNGVVVGQGTVVGNAVVIPITSNDGVFTLWVGNQQVNVNKFTLTSVGVTASYANNALLIGGGSVVTPTPTPTPTTAMAQPVLESSDGANWSHSAEQHGIIAGTQTMRVRWSAVAGAKSCDIYLNNKAVSVNGMLDADAVKYGGFLPVSGTTGSFTLRCTDANGVTKEDSVVYR